VSKRYRSEGVGAGRLAGGAAVHGGRLARRGHREAFQGAGAAARPDGVAAVVRGDDNVQAAPGERLRAVARADGDEREAVSLSTELLRQRRAR
jgi:hypothetical protein